MRVNGDLLIDDDLTVTGDTLVGNHVLPLVDAVYDLGSGTFRFRNLAMSGTAYINTIQATGSITAPSARFEATYPHIAFYDSTQPVDAKHSRLRGWGQEIAFDWVNDAGNTVLSTPVVIPRTGAIRIGVNLAFTTDATISRNTVDGSDSGALLFSGGGAYAMNRGGLIALYGEQHGTFPGNINIVTGGVAASEFRVYQNDASTVALRVAGSNGAVTIGSSLLISGAGGQPILKIGGTAATNPALRWASGWLEVVGADNSVWLPVKANYFAAVTTGSTFPDIAVSGTAWLTGGWRSSSAENYITSGHSRIHFRSTNEADGSETWTLLNYSGSFRISATSDDAGMNWGDREVVRLQRDGAMLTHTYIYPGYYGGGIQGSYGIAGHVSYGIYINTGLYVAGGIWGNVHIDMMHHPIYRAQLTDVYENIVQVTISGGWATIDLAAGNVFEVVPGAGNFNVSIVNANPGCSSFTMVVHYTSTVTAIGWPSNVRWPNGNVTPTPSPANTTDIFTFIYFDYRNIFWGSQLPRTQWY